MAKFQGNTSYADQFSMYPGGKDSGIHTDLYPDRNGTGKVLLGAKTGNVAQRQGIYSGQGGQPQRTSATDAILYENINKPGAYGYRSMDTGRYRNPHRSIGWEMKLTQSTGPNKAPHGFAQSSVDTTLEMYTTAETRYLQSGVYDRDEQWDPETKKFERKWKGWKALKVKDQWKHYTPDLARMFKEKKTDLGPARRAVRSIL